jgi:tyrosyl-tRNA synthetase
VKALLGHNQAKRFHGAAAADSAQRRFDDRFGRGQLALEDVEEERREGPLPSEILLPILLTQSGLTKSNSDARRLIAQGAVRIDGAVALSDRYQTINHRSGSFLVEVGKRRARRFRYMG